MTNLTLSAVDLSFTVQVPAANITITFATEQANGVLIYAGRDWLIGLLIGWLVGWLVD